MSNVVPSNSSVLMAVSNLDILQQIYLNLKPKDIAICSLVSKIWHLALQGSVLWKGLCERDFNDALQSSKVNPNTTDKELYKQFYRRQLNRMLYLFPVQASWNSLTIAAGLWQDSMALISSDMVEKVNAAANYLSKKALELKGVKADGNCFLTAFLKSYATLSRKIPLLDMQQNKIAFLRATIAKKLLLIHPKSVDRAYQIKQNGEWITALEEGDLLAHALSIPIRIVTVNKDPTGCGIIDMVTFPEIDKGRREWETISEQERPLEYVLIVDLGGHFVYAQTNHGQNDNLSHETLIDKIFQIGQEKLQDSSAAVLDPQDHPTDHSSHAFRTSSDHYLGSFVCNIAGDKAYLYLKHDELEAHIYSQKGEVFRLCGSQIQGGRDGAMPTQELIQLVKTIAAPFLFASYHNNTLRLFAKDFQEIQKNQFLKPRLTLPSSFFARIPRKELLHQLQKTLQEKQTLVLLKDSKLPLKRVGKTEIAQQYLQEYGKNYAYTFWIQGFDRWYLEKDLDDMAHELQIKREEIFSWLETNASYLVIWDGVENPELIEPYLPQNPKGNILITSRSDLWKYNPLPIGLLTPEEGKTFLLNHTKGTQEEAQKVAHNLGYVPSSLYRAIETIAVEGLTLGSYPTYSQTLLEKHARMAERNSNLPRRNADFVGREEGLVALEESFSSNKPVVLAANAGMGGVGKTQIALQYAYRTYPNYNLIWWISGANLDLSYGSLAERLGIYLKEEEKKEEHALVKRVNRYLERHPGWLLIFDDIQDETSLKGLLPESGGHILITSRNPHWDQTQVEVFGIEVFKREESVHLIMKVTGLYGQEAEADQLAQELQDLPLAIAQAAAYIKETGISIAEYTEDFKKWHKAVWKRETKTNNYEFTVNVTWNISMKRIQEREEKEKIVPQPIALPLMQLCSFLAPNDIPRELLLLEWLKKEYAKNQKEVEGCLSDLNRTLGLLEGFSMVKVGEKGISMHALVQTVTRDQMPEEERRRVFEGGLEILTYELNKCDEYKVDTWASSKFCLPHGITLMENEKYMQGIDLEKQWKFMNPLVQIHLILGNHPKQSLKLGEKNLELAKKWDSHNLGSQETKSAIVLSYSTIGRIFRALGKAAEALRAHQEALKISYIENHPDTAVIYNNIGGTFQDLGKTKEALEFRKKALDIWLEFYGKNHPCVSTACDNIGTTFQELGKAKEALEYTKQALDIRLKFYGENHPQIATSYGNIGINFLELGEVKKALEYTEKALKIQITIYGQNHYETAICYNNVAGALQGLGRFKDALEYRQKALGIWINLYGENHPYIATCYNNIGQNLEDFGEFKEALKYNEKALNIWTDLYDENHPRIATCYDSIGGIFQKLGKAKDALKFGERALNLLLKLHDDEKHPHVGICYDNIGAALQDVGKIEEALAFRKRALNIWLDLYDKNHPYVATSYHNIGNNLYALGRAQKALKSSKKALDIRLKLYGKNHPAVADTYDNIGAALQALGEAKKSLDNHQEALKIRLLLYHEKHPCVANSYNNIGAAFRMLRRAQEALEYDQKAFEIWLALYDKTHPNVATSYNNIGTDLQLLRRTQEALQNLQKALDIRLKLYGDGNHPHVAISYENIGLSLQALGRNAEALEKHQKALKIWLSLYGENHPDVVSCYKNIGSSILGSAIIW